MRNKNSILDEESKLKRDYSEDNLDIEEVELNYFSLFLEVLLDIRQIVNEL